MADIQNLIKIIADKASTANTASDVAHLTKIIERLDTGYFVTVTNFSELPDPTNLKLGLLYYVINDKMMYYVSVNSVGRKYWEAIGIIVNSNIYAFGRNASGKLGIGSFSSPSAVSSPVSVAGGSRWSKVSTGNNFSFALKNDGTLWSWGRNDDGVLGIEGSGDRNSPTSVVGGFADWCQISSGICHATAVRLNGTLWTWGSGNNGRLGNNTTNNNFDSPVSVVGGFTDWCQVSAGNEHTAAVRTNGTLWTWGSNGAGNLGDGTATGKCSPVSVVGGFTDWCQVSAGGSVTAAIRQNGTLWTWGRNTSGRLGDGTETDRCSPVSVVGGFTDWCQVSVGDEHTAAVRQNGTLWSWGRGTSGRLGDGTETDRCSPVSVVGGFTDWCQVSAGCHTAAIRTNGTLWTWGENGGGQLGDGTVTSRLSPVSVVGGITSWCQVYVGGDVTTAVTIRHSK